MKIIIDTKDAKKLNSKIFNAIKDDLETWEVEKDNGGFSIYYHSTKSKQWENKLYIKPFTTDNDNSKLYLIVTEIDGKIIDFEKDFGYLMGRFLEILIVHFSDYYNKIEIK